MSAASSVYCEIINFIAAGFTPEEVARFRPPTAAQQRVEELIARERGDGLSIVEKVELDHFMELAHLLRIAKAKVRYNILSRGQ